MKKTAILLSLILSAFIISSCAEKNPNNPDNSNNIPLSERAGTYSGTITVGNMNLVMVLDATGTLTSLMVNGNESADPNNPIKVGEPNSKETVFGPFTATVKIGPASQSSRVRITFNSGTDKTLGAKAEIDLKTEGTFNPTMNADLKYQAN